MKRIGITLIAVSAGFFILACKKDYTCNCTTYTTDPGTGSVTETKTSYAMKATEKDADIWCKGKSTSAFDPSEGIPSSATSCEMILN